MLVSNRHRDDIQENQKCSLTKASNVMSALLSIANTKGYSKSALLNMSNEESNKVFDEVYLDFVHELYDSMPNRPFETTCDSLGNRMYKRARTNSHV